MFIAASRCPRCKGNVVGWRNRFVRLGHPKKKREQCLREPTPVTLNLVSVVDETAVVSGCKSG